MPDVTTLTVAVPAPVAPAEPKSGWRTTELYVSVALLGGLATIIEQVIQLVPTIMATPGIPPWVGPIALLIPVALGWLGKLVHKTYVDSRVALKLAPAAAGPDTSSAVAAGAAAVIATPAERLTGINQ